MSDDEDFAALYEQSAKAQGARGKPVEPGQVVQATVVQIGRDLVFVDVGTRAEGEIERHELEDEQGRLTVKVGDRIKLTVSHAGDRPKLVTRFGGGAGIEGLELALESGAPIEGVVSKAIKGGLEVQIGKLRAFCPASQVDLNYTPDISIYEGQTLRFKVVEIREGGRSIVVSRKALMQDERAVAGRERMASLEPGQIVEGTVQTIQSYGAFVDIGGIEGLIHISELGHGRVGSVSEVVSVGETVQVKILAIEPSPTPNQPPRISLSLRQATQGNATPTASEAAKGPVVLDAEVVKVEPFGVFVETASGAGVVPTRELDLPPGGDPRRAYPVGKQVRVVAIGADEKGRPRYSMRRVEEAEQRADYQQFRSKQGGGDKGKGNLGSLGELLSQKLRK
ncbi:S1 RNA-binding domain-containing protein [Nannocystaceae bacterium ST9]